MISLVTNVDSLDAQRNLNIDNQFQSNTIQQLTSGYRINSSGDDAAGLAIANGYRSSVAELNQGVMNANDGISQLQIVDGGLSNISTILDRLKTLATESASTTFTGSRATLNQEYSQLLTEVSRQAANINLNAGGTFNSLLSVYIGGATDQTNASVSVDLSGTNSAVDATSLGLAGTNVLGGGGAAMAGNTQNLTTANSTFVVGTSPANDQTFTFNVFSGGTAQSVTATVPATSGGSTLTNVLSTLNSQLNQYGITAGTDGNGALQFTGTNAFTVADTPGSGSSLLTNESTLKGADVYTPPAANNALTITNAGGASATVTFKGGESVAQAISEINAQSSALGITAVLNTQGTGINLVSASGTVSAVGSVANVAGIAGTTAVTSTAGGVTDNSANYTLDGASTWVASTGTETMQFTTANGDATVNLGGVASLGAAITAINAQTASLGIYAVKNAAGTGISLQSSNGFSMTDTNSVAAQGFYGANTTTTAANATAQTPTAAVTGNATDAISAINSAIQTLGLVQGRVGAGENLLSYAVSLAQSQISSFSAAESQIRDADVAAQAANLTKAQVLTQTSVAALAQANSEPQAILKLLQG